VLIVAVNIFFLGFFVYSLRSIVEVMCSKKDPNRGSVVEKVDSNGKPLPNPSSSATPNSAEQQQQPQTVYVQLPPQQIIIVHSPAPENNNNHGQPSTPVLADHSTSIAIQPSTEASTSSSSASSTATSATTATTDSTATSSSSSSSVDTKHEPEVSTNTNNTQVAPQQIELQEIKRDTQTV
jgi:hypothetical protein